MRHRRLLASAAVFAMVGTLTAFAAADAAKKPKGVPIQILAVNDFHGNLEPPTGSSGRVGEVDAGGVEYLATHVDKLRNDNRKATYVVSAGDLIGASPLVSGLFHDEPTIEAMNAIGLDYDAVGNHEFDEGVAELKRMQRGGCHLKDGCIDGDGFGGADFGFLAANVVNARSGKTAFPAYRIANRGGAKVAFLGLTLEGTPDIVAATGIKGYEFKDEVSTINALVPRLKQEGADAVVVLLHQGGQPATFDYNGCQGVAGPIVDIVEGLDKRVDLVVSGHTHQAYNCVVEGIPTTSAYSFGRLVTDIDMTVDPKAHAVTSMKINNKVVTRTVAKDPGMTSLIARYAEKARPIANRAVGQITADLVRAPDPSGENPLGNAIADAQLFAAPGAVLAFMNPGGVRADLTYANSPEGEGDGVVTYGELFTVQPFGNGLLTMDLTGTQIGRVLEQQFCGTNAPANDGSPRVLLPSAGFHYTWKSSAAGAASCDGADAVDPASITLNGAPLNLGISYKVVVNTFLADGGDGFAAFRDGTNRVGGPVDTDAFEAYLKSLGSTGLAPPKTDRVDTTP